MKVLKLSSNFVEIKFTNEEFKGLEHNYLLTRNGVRLHYVSGGNVDAPLMLFIHGFPEVFQQILIHSPELVQLAQTIDGIQKRPLCGCLRYERV